MALGIRFGQNGSGDVAGSKPPASGIEAMLRSMGLGQVIEVAQQLATEGTVAKILAFAEGLDALQAQLVAMKQQQDLIEAQNYAILSRLGGNDDVDGSAVKPGSSSADVELEPATGGNGDGALETNRTVARSPKRRHSTRDDHHDGSDVTREHGDVASVESEA